MSLGIDYPSLVQQFREDLDLPEDIAASRVLAAYRQTMRLFDTYAASVKAQTASIGGAVIIAASGNESRRDEDERFTVHVAPPAAAEGITSVGAVGQAHDSLCIAAFSATGCDLVGPGMSIVSAGLGGSLATMSGTSMATPHVAEVCALWTRHEFPNGERPAIWTQRIRTRLRASARRLEAPDDDVGYGLVQAPAAAD